MINRMIYTFKEHKKLKPSLASTIPIAENFYPFSLGFSETLPLKATFRKNDKKLAKPIHAKENMSETIENQHYILEDAALMEKVANGDNNSCRIIIEKHTPHIYRIAYRVLHQQGEAEDVVQEAFIKLWKLAPKWKPQAKILTWLYRVTMNAALDRIRKRPIAREVNLELYMPFAPASISVEADIATEERNQQVLTLHKALQNLPKRYQMVLNLCYFENLKVREVATILKLSPRATESLLKRARGRLKLIFQNEALVKPSKKPLKN